MKKSYYVGILLLVICLVSSVGYWQWITSPQYSIWQAKEALEKHDLVKFEKYVNIEAVVESLLAEVVPDFVQPMLALFKPQLVKLAKQEIVYYVEKDNLDEEKQTETDLNFSFSDLSKKTLDNKGEFQGLEYVKKEAGYALVGLKFLPEKSTEPLILELQMQDQGNYWRIVGISNLSDFVKRIGEENDGRETTETN